MNRGELRREILSKTIADHEGAVTLCVDVIEESLRVILDDLDFDLLEDLSIAEDFYTAIADLHDNLY